FAIALFFSPILAVITTEITAPALIIVGSMMAMQISKIDWSKLEIVIPSFLTIIMMPLTSSVATGIAFGFILYPLSLAAQKHIRLKTVSFKRDNRPEPGEYDMVRLFLGFILSSLSDTLQVPFQNPLYSTRVDNQADCKGIPLRISPLLRIGNVYGQMSLFLYLGNESTNHLYASFP